MARSRSRSRLAATALGVAVAIPSMTAVSATGVAATTCLVTGAGPATSDLQGAIDAASPGAVLRISGTCVGNFTIDKSLTLQRRAGASSATLKGASGRPLTITDGTVRLTRIRITGGRAPDCPAWSNYVCGGGLYIHESGTVTLDRVFVDHNVAAGTGLSTSSYGGGIYSGGSLTLIRTTVIDNQATADDLRGDAAGIASDGPLVIRWSLVASNTSRSLTDQSWGGGIYQYQNHVLVADSTIHGNVAAGKWTGLGGGLFLHDGAATIRRTLISGNRASVTSGTDAAGGGVASSGPVTIENSTLVGNLAHDGAAINTSGGLRVTSSTIARNRAEGDGGGLLQTAGVLTMGSTILAQNVAGGSGEDCRLAGAVSIVDRGWNLLGTGDGCPGFTAGARGNQVGTNATRINPRLGRVADNGGSTPTMALLSRSPALDRAGRAPCATTGDQRGVRRPQHGRCDIGAYERR